MKSADIRRIFLDYFRDRDHKIVPSSSLVPADPTLLLTAAGMVQFKPIFLGKESVDYTRAASVQRCVRTTDIDRVGHTARHLTFFEMLGNFSFGDYYKKEAGIWAWDLLTNCFKLPREKLWVTIFETDEEAFQVWRDEVGVTDERIVRLGERDNFWAAGQTGPCGPCSEIIYDFGPERSCDDPNCGVGCDCDRYLEVWNLVFMQYNRDEKGELHPLPRKNIDTGMGLERLASLLQGTETNFEIDIIKPLIDIVAAIANAKYGQDAKVDISLKVIVDHLRAVAFMIGDGVMPLNEGRGYILRRLLRRSVRHGRLIGIERPFVVTVIDEVVRLMGDVYPEINENREFIKKVVSVEEERFNHTLKQGLTIINEVMKDIREKEATRIPGDLAFKLYDTYGFPLELTAEIAAESGLEVDMETFNEMMAEQRERARAEAVTAGGYAEMYVGNVYPRVLERSGESDFTGYETHEIEANLVAVALGDQIIEEAEKGQEVECFLDHTPFYPERGGQVGDTGVIVTDTGKAEVTDTYSPLAGLIAHKACIIEGFLKARQSATAAVDERRRQAISRNHTATHLLNWALRIILGKHVKQAGSLVAPDKLRFDFTHHQPLTPEDVAAVEKLVNEKVLQNHPVRAYTTTFEYAKDVGALAFFEEKYGKFVRLVEIGDFSKELCGGIHLGRTSEVGFFKITVSTSIGANTRRIEAITGESFLDRYNENEERLNKLAQLMGVRTDQLYEAIEQLKQDVAIRQKELASLRSERLAEEIEAISAGRIEIKGVSLFSGQLGAINMDELRGLADRLRSKGAKSIVVLASAADSKVSLLVAATPKLVEEGFSAVEMIRTLAPIVGGGGGGRADLAQAGGKNPANIPKIFPAAKSFVENFLGKK